MQRADSDKLEATAPKEKPDSLRCPRRPCSDIDIPAMVLEISGVHSLPSRDRQQLDMIRSSTRPILIAAYNKIA